MRSNNESESGDHMLEIVAGTFSETTIISARSTLSSSYVEMQIRFLVVKSETFVWGKIQKWHYCKVLTVL